MPAAVSRRAALACVVVLVIVVVVVGSASTATAQRASEVVYRPPVDAPVHDPFRAPTTPFGPGHRGIEYDTGPGTPVAAAAQGTVVFAGAVAGDLWVTIRHPDGVRTTYGPLAMFAVAVGDIVNGGDVVGSTTGRLLLTARVDGNYVDPALLLSNGPEVHLVPEPASLPSFSPSSFGVGDLFSPDALVSALSWGTDRVTEKVEAVYGVTPMPFVLHGVGALAAWRERQDNCTADDAPVAVPTGHRVAILVAGIGSSSNGAAIEDVDTSTLGYAPGDVIRFSYRGGRVPSARPIRTELASIDATSYSPDDSAGDLEVAGHRLADLLSAAAAAVPPSAPLDVYAHSQGGIVLQIALAELAAREPAVLGRLGVVVTLASPYHGAELAGLVDTVTAAPFGQQSADAVGALAGVDLRAEDPAIRQLAPGSSLLNELAAESLPAGPHYVSIAAQRDPVVPSPDAHLDGADNVIVPVGGLDAHAALPGSTAATREMALALAGLPPACESASDAVLDAIWGDLLHNGEQFLTATRGP